MARTSTPTKPVNGTTNGHATNGHSANGHTKNGNGTKKSTAYRQLTAGDKATWPGLTPTVRTRGASSTAIAFTSMTSAAFVTE